jgi:hypothetical protein
MNIAIVTGASSSMGREFVLQLKDYVSVDEIWVIARRKAALESLKEESSLPIRPIALDLCDSNSFSAMEKLEAAVDKLRLDDQMESRDVFLDSVVMAEVLGELKDIAARGGISCGCGSSDYGIKVGYSSVELVCARCGGTLRLEAATPDDIDGVCARYTLTIPGKE